MVEENSNMILDTGDKPSSLRWILLALQHVCAMFGATILVPIVVNTTAGANILSIPVTLVSSGLGTLIYLICTRNRSPVYLGSSFAFITPMVAGYAIGGAGSVFTALMIVGIVYVIISLIIRVFGPEWINKLLPPHCCGTYDYSNWPFLGSSSYSTNRTGFDIRSMDKSPCCINFISDYSNRCSSWKRNPESNSNYY